MRQLFGEKTISLIENAIFVNFNLMENSRTNADTFSTYTRIELYFEK